MFTVLVFTDEGWVPVRIHAPTPIAYATERRWRRRGYRTRLSPEF